jgi:ABC-type multidrug transport system fused ATPase/permease subunit
VSNTRGQGPVSVAVSMAALGVATVLTLLQPLLVGRLVDRAAAGAPSLGLATWLVLMLVGQLFLEAVGRFWLEKTGDGIVFQVQAAFTDHVVRLPIGLLDRCRSGDLLARATSDVSLLREMPRAVADVVFGAVTFVGANIFMLTIDAATVGVVIAVNAVAFAAATPLLARILRATVDRQAALGEYTASLDRALGAARTVKLYGAEDREVRSISASAHAAYGAGVRIALSTAIVIPLVRLGVTGALVAIMIIDGRRVAGGGLPVGQFVSLFLFAMYTVFPVTLAFTALTILRTSAGAYQHLTGTLGELQEGDSHPLAVGAGASGVSTLPGRRADQDTAPLVEFDHVSFSYGKGPILDDVSFTLLRDQMTALIGPSGSGKSTILALLCRFHDPGAGAVRWEGDDVRGIPLKELRGRLGLLEQDAAVLDGTIRDNLLIAAPDAADADLWLVLEQANIADEIARLPEQLDTPVLERGRGLSGGQRQRLALARALLSSS